MAEQAAAGASAGPPSVGYLGPEGTFSEEALLADAQETVRPVAMGSLNEAVTAVQQRRVRWAVVPIENSIEGAVSVVLDALALDAQDVRICGELVRVVRQCLIAAGPVALEQVRTVVSHPQASGQCARFLREHLPEAVVVPAASTAEAVRTVAERGDRTWAALGPRLAAAVYGATVLRENVEDHHDNQTRFVWLSRVEEQSPPPRRREPSAADGWRTTLLFWGPGARGPGWLVGCLDEFARRELNLTRIESRPRHGRLGSYMFFADVEGAEGDAPVADAIAGLRGHCGEVRVLGSYPAAAPAPEAGGD